MNYFKWIVVPTGFLLLGGCATGKVYEDDTVAIYNVCNPGPPLCHKEVIRKKPLSTTNVEVNGK